MHKGSQSRGRETSRADWLPLARLAQVPNDVGSMTTSRTSRTVNPVQHARIMERRKERLARAQATADSHALALLADLRTLVKATDCTPMQEITVQQQKFVQEPQPMLPSLLDGSSFAHFTKVA